MHPHPKDRGNDDVEGSKSNLCNSSGNIHLSGARVSCSIKHVTMHWVQLYVMSPNSKCLHLPFHSPELQDSSSPRDTTTNPRPASPRESHA